MSAPHTDESHHMIGARELALMKKGAGLVNYSRANCVDYDALIGKLERGEMSAVLDVFDPEPLPARSPLWEAPNVIITPHCSSDDSGYYTPRTLDLVFENVERYLAASAQKPGAAGASVLSKWSGSTMYRRCEVVTDQPA